MNTPELLGFILNDMLWAGLAALGFAILFNVPARLLPACIVCGMVGHLTRELLVSYAHVSLEAATFAGAIVIGVFGSALAHRLHAPAPIFQIAAAITLVPGAFAYRSMLGFIRVTSMTGVSGNAALEEALIFSIRTAVLLGAIAIGIAVPTLLFRRKTLIQD
jgi:uncharacterized membrane protein YjjB (DUF3815 family)